MRLNLSAITTILRAAWENRTPVPSMASWYNNHYTNAAKFYNHRLVEHPRLTILSVRTKLNCDTILSSKTTTIFIILYPWKNSNPHQQIRGLVCCPLHHKGIWSRVVESNHSNWFCRPGPNRSANPTLFVEISGLEPELREPKSLVLPLHHISISKQE